MDHVSLLASWMDWQKHNQSIHEKIFTMRDTKTMLEKMQMKL